MRIVLPIFVFATLAASLAHADGKKLPPAAQAHMDAGLKLYGAKQYVEAAREFEAAYAIQPEASMLYASAQALRLGGECARALPLYRKYLEAQLKDDQITAARTGVESCEAKLAAEPKPAPEPVKPPPLEPKPEPVTLPPQTESPRWYKDPIGGGLVVAGAIGIGVGIGFVVAGGNSESKAKSAEFRDDFGSLLDEATSRKRIGAIALGTGVALVAGGVAVYVLRDRGGKRTQVGTTGQGLYIAGVW